MTNRQLSIITIILISFCSAVSIKAETLRVMTYNVRNGVGMDNARDHARTADVIKAQLPDVVAVQEVDSMTRRSGKCYVLAELGTLSEMYPVYAPAIDYDGGKYGIGMLCKQPPLTTRHIPLPGREEARALLIVEFPEYVVACTHLSLTLDDALASTEIIRREVGRYSKPFILMGDLNSHPDSDVIDSLKQDFCIISPMQPTWPADNPEECLDYIMIANVPDIKVDAPCVVTDTIASDHRPIIVKIELPD